MKVVLVDGGLGNLRSVEKALAHVGADVTVTGDPEVVRAAERVVVPGQGHFGAAARVLGAGTPLGDALLEAIARRTPYLGICLGLQILFAGSDEAPGARGLGVIDGRVVRLEGAPKLPHIGWNRVESGDPRLAHHFYFAHSYVAEPRLRSVVTGRFQHGDGPPRCAAVAQSGALGVQFHPEKSQAAGLALLRAFVTGRR